MPINRMKITEADVDAAVAELKAKIMQIMAEKGDGAYATTHEASGALDEEVREFKDAIHDRSPTFRNEGLDVAVAGLFSTISYDAHKEAGELDSFVR